MADEAKNEAGNEVSFVDAVMGGASPSPEPKKAGLTENPAEPPKEFGDEPESPFEDPETESGKASPGKEEKKEEKGEKSENPKDSGKEENATDKSLDINAKQSKEIERLTKRLRDTQSAYHKATSEKAKAEKELAELKTKKSGDDWFSDEDKKKEATLEKAIQEHEAAQRTSMEQSKEIEVQAAEAAWESASAQVRAEHKDFDQMVDLLVSALDEKSEQFDAAVKAEYQKVKDKSPASVYAFAKKLADFQAYVKDPEGFKANRQPKDTNNNEETDRTIKGKEGLDMVNSAAFPSSTKTESESFVDAVFKN